MVSAHPPPHHTLRREVRSVGTGKCGMCGTRKPRFAFELDTKASAARSLCCARAPNSAGARAGVRTERAKGEAIARARDRARARAHLALYVTLGNPAAPQLALDPRVALPASSRESTQYAAQICAAIHVRMGLADPQQVGVGGLCAAVAQPCAALEVRETFQGVTDPAELDLARRGHLKTSTGALARLTSAKSARVPSWGASARWARLHV